MGRLVELAKSPFSFSSFSTKVLLSSTSLLSKSGSIGVSLSVVGVGDG